MRRQILRLATGPQTEPLGADRGVAWESRWMEMGADGADALQPADRPESDRRGSIGRAIPENSAVILFAFMVSWLPNFLPFFNCGFAALRLCGSNCMATAKLKGREDH